jgi:hypothetical protein
MTYHGYFTGGQRVSATHDPYGLCTNGDFTGIWTVRIPSGSTTAVAHVMIHKDGKSHANWKIPFAVARATGDGFTLVQDQLPPPMDKDVLTLTLKGGAFTYTLAGDNPVFVCTFRFTGTQQN